MWMIGRMAAVMAVVWPVVVFGQATNVVPEARVAGMVERLGNGGEREGAVKELIGMGVGSVPGLVQGLEDPRGEVRTGVAEAWRVLTKDATVVPGNHGRAVWEGRIAQLRTGMALAEVLGNLLPELTAEERGKRAGLMLGSGRTEISQYRLDDYWMVTIYMEFAGGLQAEPAKLSESAAQVYVKPAETFSGEWTTYFVNGQRSNVIHFKDGKYEGLFQAFYDNGNPAYEQHYVAMVSQGSDRGWYRSGKKMYEGQYVANKQEGAWTHWFENGQVQLAASYKAGVWDGPRTAWFENGQMQYEEHYVMGKKDGSDTAWDEAGKVLWRRVFKDGVLVEGY